jgi:hypothetical protein
VGVTHHHHHHHQAESLTIAPTLLKCNCGARTHDGCVNLEEYLLPRIYDVGLAIEDKRRTVERSAGLLSKAGATLRALPLSSNAGLQVKLGS